MSNDALMLHRIAALKEELEQANSNFNSATHVIGCLVLQNGGRVEIPLQLEDELDNKIIKTWKDDIKNCLVIEVEDAS